MKYTPSVTVVALLAVFSVHSARAQPKLIALTNEDVIRLVAMRVSDDTVIAVINEAKATQLDLSPSAEGDLVDFGVSSAVIAAMRHPSAPTPVPTTATPKNPAAASTITPNEADRIAQAADRLERATLAAGNRAQWLRNQEVLDSQLFSVKSVNYRVTEANKVFVRFGWIVIIHNSAGRAQAFDLTVQFLDKDGFLIDSARAYSQTVGAFDERTLTGDKLISMPGALRVGQVKAIATRKR